MIHYKSLPFFPLTEWYNFFFSQLLLVISFYPDKENRKKIKVDKFSCPGNKSQARFQLINNAFLAIPFRVWHRTQDLKSTCTSTIDAARNNGSHGWELLTQEVLFTFDESQFRGGVKLNTQQTILPHIW